MLIRKKFIENILRVQKSWKERQAFLLLTNGEVAKASGISSATYNTAVNNGTDKISVMIAIERAFEGFEKEIKRDYKNAIRRQNFSSALVARRRALEARKAEKQRRLRDEFVGGPVEEQERPGEATMGSGTDKDAT